MRNAQYGGEFADKSADYCVRTQVEDGTRSWIEGTRFLKLFFEESTIRRVWAFGFSES